MMSPYLGSALIYSSQLHDNSNINLTTSMRKILESSESEQSQDQNQFRITTNPHHERYNPNAKYEESSESDNSSLSMEQQDVTEKRYPNVLKIDKKTIEHQTESDSQSYSEDSSGIDHIEQRIRRLQNDLEQKIGRQKNNQYPRKEQIESNQKKEQQKLPTKSVNPPLPIKKVQQKQNNNEGGYIRSLTNTSENKNNINVSGNNSNIYQKQRQEKKDGSVAQKLTKQHQKEVIEEKAGPTTKAQELRQKSKQYTSDQRGNSSLKKAHQQISQLQKVIEQLRKENLLLKQQLVQKEKKQKKHQTQEIEVLKMGAGCENLKLQKQIETLKALESLQKKLKKSISKQQKLQGHNNGRSVQKVRRKQ